MTQKSREIIAEGIAEELALEELVDQREKTNDRAMRQVIDDELAERRKCPECRNDMMFDKSERELYCPVGHYSFEV
jgi:hypothetical protein